MIDVQIIEALEGSLATGPRAALPEFPADRRVTPRQARRFPAVWKPPLVRVQSGSQ